MKGARMTPADLAKTAAGRRPDNQHIFAGDKKSGKSCKKDSGKVVEPLSKEKAWIHEQLTEWCDLRELKLKTEYCFHYARKWRADWAIPAKKILVEFEGLMSEKSRHTTVTGYTEDAEKYTTAQALGWRVIRLTVINYQELLNHLKNFE